MQLTKSLRIAAAGLASAAGLVGADAAQAVSFTPGNIVGTVGNFRTAANPNPATYELDMNLGSQSGFVPGYSVTFALPAAAGGSLVGQTFALYGEPDPNKMVPVFYPGAGTFDSAQANLLFSTPLPSPGSTLNDNTIQSGANAALGWSNASLLSIGSPNNTSSGVFLNNGESSQANQSYGSQLAPGGVQQLNGSLSGVDIGVILDSSILGSGQLVQVWYALQGFQDIDPSNPATSVAKAFQLLIQETTSGPNAGQITLSIPVPEPASAAMVVTGLLGLAFAGRRRQTT